MPLIRSHVVQIIKNALLYREYILNRSIHVRVLGTVAPASLQGRYYSQHRPTVTATTPVSVTQELRYTFSENLCQKTFLYSMITFWQTQPN